MKIYHGIQELEGNLPTPVIALGNFDGVHLGHQRLIEVAKERAEAIQGAAGIYTFRPHPAKVLAPDLSPPLLTTYEEKNRLISQWGIDFLIEEEFNNALANKSGRQFITEHLVEKLGVREVVIGPDFTFGRRRESDVQALKRFGQEQGFAVHVEPPVKLNRITISSTKIRSFLMEGRVRGAAMMLGREYEVWGKVIEGVGRGRQLGFPTANLETRAELIPQPGVYACRAIIDGKRYRAATNVGFNPTFEGHCLTIESFIIDFSEDIYAREIGVAFCLRIRNERRFASVADLSQQISSDIERVKELL